MAPPHDRVKLAIGRARRIAVLRASFAAGTFLLGSFLAVNQAIAMFAGSNATSEMPSSGARLEVSDDDGVSAMFDLSQMSPGHAASNCIAISYQGPALGAVVRLHGVSVGSGLDPYIRMTVEEGDGGRFNECARFRGRVLYRGSLAAFADAHRDFRTGLATLSPLDVPDTKTFRFSVVLRDDPAAQGRSAEATFTWEAQESAVPQPPDPGGSTSPTRSMAPLPAEGALPRVTMTPSTGGTGGAEGIGRGQRDRDFLEWLRAVTLEALKKGGLPILLLLIVVAFLTIQDRIDRRDPKLALAPIHSEPDVPFKDRLSSSVKRT